MAGMNTFLSYLSAQVTGADDFWSSIKAPALGGTLTWDDFFKASSKFWVGSLLRWWGAWPFAEGTPVAFAAIGAGTVNYPGTPMAIATLPANTQIKVQLNPLIATGGATGTPVATLQADGTLKIDVNALANLKKGDLLLVVAYYDLAGGAQQTIALLLLSVT